MTDLIHSIVSGIIADHGDDEVSFHTQAHMLISSSISSLDIDSVDPFDLSVYMDEVGVLFSPSMIGTNSRTQAPLCIQSNAPLEGVHQFFKWGARYVVVTDYDGECEDDSCSNILTALTMLCRRRNY